MKKFLIIMVTILLSITVLLSTPLSSQLLQPASTHFYMLPVKKGVFADDFKIKVNGIVFDIKKGCSYTTYKNIKEAIKSLPQYCFTNLDSIILTTKNPYTFVKFDDAEYGKKMMKREDVQGLTSSYITSNCFHTDIIVKDTKDSKTTFIHEMFHHIDVLFREDNHLLTETKEFEDAFADFRTTAVDKNISPIASYFVDQPNSELFAYTASFIYCENFRPQMTELINTYPEIIEFYDNIYARLTELSKS